MRRQQGRRQSGEATAKDADKQDAVAPWRNLSLRELDFGRRVFVVWHLKQAEGREEKAKKKATTIEKTGADEQNDRAEETRL